MFARCFSHKKHCAITAYYYQFKRFMKSTLRPSSSLMFSQVYVQTEKKSKKHPAP